MKFLRSNYPYLVVLLPAIYFAIFLHLDALPFRIWDESFLAMHTYEMMEDHDYIVTHSFGQPEMWNTKPPLVIWCMVLSSKIFGFSELSVRMPNALAGIIICLLIFFLMSARLDSPLTGFLAAMILLASAGFVSKHVIRSGEYDAILMLFILIYSLCFFTIVENPTVRSYWYLFAITVIGAILTKGIAGVLVIPGFFIYVVIQKKLPVLLRTKELYVAALLILGVGVGYYLLREHFNPGYITAVSENELGGRYMSASESHKENFFFFWYLISGYQMGFIMPFVFVGIAKAFLEKEAKPIDKIVRFFTCVSITFLLIISFSATKLFWYDAPAMPMIAVMAGYGFSITIRFLFGEVTDSLSVGKKGLIAVFIMAVIGPSYAAIISEDLNMADFDIIKHTYMATYYIKKNENSLDRTKTYKLIYDQFQLRSQLCQIKSLEHRGPKIEIVNLAQLKKGDRVIIDKENTRTQIDSLFSHLELDSLANVKVWDLR